MTLITVKNICSHPFNINGINIKINETQTIENEEDVPVLLNAGLIEEQ